MPTKPLYYLTIALLFSLFPCVTTAQNELIDSLSRALENTSNGEKQVTLNYQLGKNYFRINDLASASKHAELSYNGAKELGLDSIVANASNMWGIIRIYQGQTEHSIQLLKESNRMSLQLKDSAGVAASYSLLSNIHNQYLNDPISAFTYLDSAERYYQKEELDKIVFGKIVKGSIFTNVSEYQSALEEYYSALDLSGGDTTKMVSLHINLGAVFAAMGNRESALEHYRKGLRLTSNNQIQRATLYNNIANYFYDIEQADSALYFVKKARVIFEETKHVRELFQTKATNCQYLFEFNEVDSAKMLFATVDTANLSMKEKLSWWILSYNLGEPRIDLNELAQNFELTKTILNDELFLMTTDFLFEMYAKRGNVKKALLYKTSYSDRKDQIVASEKIALGHAVKLKRIVSAKNEEIVESRIANEQLKYSVKIEEERKEKWRYTTILAIVLSLIMLYSLYILYKRKSDKLVFNKRELEHEKMRKGILINKLEAAKESMNDKNIEIEVLLSNVASNGTDRTTADTMMTNLKERNWSIFLTDFELIYPRFFTTISNYTTTALSKNERRLCALIKLNLSNKEMSEYVFVSQESIKKAKNRLFKKFEEQGAGHEISDLLRSL